MAVRAIIREADLRRWARIAREERVTIRGRIDGKGGVTIQMTAVELSLPTDPSDLDARLDAFGSL